MTTSRRHTTLLCTLLLLVGVAPTRAGNDRRTERVRFKPGATSATIESSIKGYQSVDYLVGAAAGQHMNVSMATKHGAAYFNILAPGETDVALFNGSVGDNQYEGTLPSGGDYTIRVYLMRAAARRNEVATFRLEVVVSGAGAQSAGPGDAKVAGTEFHATGNVPCATAKGQPTGSCTFGVVRRGGGNATVTVTKPDGRSRAIFFEAGKATGSDASQADGGAFRATREGDTTTVHVGDERYEIPDAVVSGG